MSSVVSANANANAITSPTMNDNNTLRWIITGSIIGLGFIIMVLAIGFINMVIIKLLFFIRRKDEMRKKQPELINTPFLFGSPKDKIFDTTGRQPIFSRTFFSQTDDISQPPYIIEQLRTSDGKILKTNLTRHGLESGSIISEVPDLTNQNEFTFTITKIIDNGINLPDYQGTFDIRTPQPVVPGA